MKILIYAPLIALTFSSCSEGLPGDIFLAITQDGYVSSYWDDNDCIPYGFTYGYYYGPCSEGTYNFEYSYSGGYWYGTYYIYSNPGTTGLFGGKDGEDNFFTFYCSWAGSSITSRDGETVRSKTITKTETESIKEFNLKDYTIKIIETREKRPSNLNVIPKI